MRVNSNPLCRQGIRAVVVDLDGTMVDTMGDFVAVLNLMLRQMELPEVRQADVEPLVGKGSEHLIRSVLTHVGAPAGRYEAAWALYQGLYLQENGRHSKVYEGVQAGIELLHRAGATLACLTNKPTAFARALLEDKGLLHYFSVVYGGDAFERKKPDPLPLLKTCESLGVLPQHTLMIGDSSNDAQAARSAGCPVVLVTYGYNHGEPVRAVDADGFVDSLADVPALLAGAFARLP